MVSFKKSEWFSNIRVDILAGIVVALALVPEAIAFSIIAGVDPQIGLFASFTTGHDCLCWRPSGDDISGNWSDGTFNGEPR